MSYLIIWGLLYLTKNKMHTCDPLSQYLRARGHGSLADALPLGFTKESSAGEHT